MADISGASKYFPIHKEGFVTTLSSSISAGAATVPLTTVSGLTDGDTFVGIVKPGVSGEQCFTGVVDTSGSQITSVTWTTGSDIDHAAGSTVVDYVTSTSQNLQSTGVLVEHNQDGTHSDITADSITTDSLTITGSADAEGWSALGQTLTYSSNDGNKQATYTVSGTDVTGTVQEGMKVKLPRPTAVGTQCADLEASSSQYASKSSPSGCTFTDDFTCGAWVKIESYQNADVISRYSGTGWILKINTDGTVSNFAEGASSRTTRTYGSLPLDEWVYITATVNMSAGTFAIYINGVAVSVSEAGAGTSLTQAGDLTVGGRSGGGFYFDGKIKHAFVADKVLSAAEVKEAMVSDDLSSASFSADLVAYYKLEGDFTDDSGNSNDLTAQNGAVATDTDSPFSSTEYGIVTSASFSTDTTITVFTGSGVPVNENVTAPAYSTHRVPYGFPAGKDKWQLVGYNYVLTEFALSTSYQRLYNDVYLPIGSWEIEYKATYVVTQTSTVARSVIGAVSTSTSTPTVGLPAAYSGVDSDAAGSVSIYRNQYDKTIYRTDSAIQLYGIVAISSTTGLGSFQTRADQYYPTKIVATCAYI